MTSVTLLTPPGRAAIAVVSVRGEHALARVATIAPALRNEPAEPGSIKLVRLRAGEDELDECLVCTRSRTEVELHLHGSPQLVADVMEALAPLAAGGAGGSGAHLDSDRGPSLEERAFRLLAAAPGGVGEAGARVLLDQAQGALRSALEALRALEGSALAQRTGELVERGRVARFLLRPARVVLAGPVNAGKSTLFNVLVGEERVLVRATAGTTRDAIEARASFGAYPVMLCDTAGERPLTGDSPAANIEREGQALAAGLRRSADLVVELTPLESQARPRPSNAESRGQTLLLRTFADRLGREPGAWPADTLSALHEPEHAALCVASGFRRAFDLPSDPWQPGTAVPFAPELEAQLARLAAAQGPERDRILELLLAH